jgi:hypothetical protein
MKRAKLIGWLAVWLSTSAAGFWAFWGAIEAFHEGWCKPLLWMRLLQVMAYLTPAALLCAITAAGIRWPRVGAAICILVGVGIAWLIVTYGAGIGTVLAAEFTALPALLALMFLYGRPEPKKAAYLIAVGLPALIAVACGIEPAIRVSTRFDDGYRGARVVEGNGIKLLWAPAGPGWDRDGNVPWADAMERVRRLTKDGFSLAEEPQDIWRLPTRQEIVRSLTRGNRNAGGVWDPIQELPTYERTPDKESPLWDPLAPLIYLWTRESVDDKHAWIVVYHGGVFAKPKALGASSNGFRAVREPDSSELTKPLTALDATAKPRSK